ncbi:MAG: methionyl-tRNA formyltransferase [Lachnospiraceae bacterium]|nr:methionyl-tRNA formyltransferase [Lachnospiraceae bacterium]
MSLKIVFMGTPDFAVGALQALIEAGHEIVAVVTQPDKAKGRSGKLSFSPVKECALENGLPVFQPERIKRPEAVAELKKYEADIFVVAAFGQILSKEILDMPRLGCINIHASLLPKYRGSSPIQWSVINGEEKTGVTIQQMNEGVDTGDILYQKEIVLDKKETGESLFDRLAVLGAEAVVEVLPLIEEGKVTPVPQNHEEATHTVMLDKAMGHMDFTKNAIELERLVRGLNSWPSAYTYFDGKQLKIWESDLCEEEELSDEEQVYVKNAKPGEVVKVEKNRFAVACGNGALWITSLQLEGKKRMSTHDFLLGNAMEKGMVLG